MNDEKIKVTVGEVSKKNYLKLRGYLVMQGKSVRQWFDEQMEAEISYNGDD